MISDLRARVEAAAAAYGDEEAATRSALDAMDTAIAAIHRLIEQNGQATTKTRIAYNFKGGMTQGGEQATRTHDQIRDNLANQLRASIAVRAGLERIMPLLSSNHSIAEQMLNVLGG